MQIQPTSKGTLIVAKARLDFLMEEFKNNGSEPFESGSNTLNIDLCPCHLNSIKVLNLS